MSQSAVTRRVSSGQILFRLPENQLSRKQEETIPGQPVLTLLPAALNLSSALS